MKACKSFQTLLSEITDYFMREPKRLIRLIVLSCCCVIVFFQLWECAMKLFWPPTSTHFNFHLNDSMYYPAITFCRDPPFKRDIMQKYNLSYHPSHTSSWRNFPFNEKTLADLYEEATYAREEFFGIYGLNGLESNLDVVMSLHFSYGRCYTLIPIVTTDLPWKQSGYVVTLKHELRDNRKIEEDLGVRQGWSMYLHEPREEFTEYGISSSGRIENLFVEVNEELELKMSVHHYIQFRGRGSSCSDDATRSKSICRENCIWRYVEDSVKCSGPWMKKPRSQLCSSYEEVKELIVQYNNYTSVGEKECGCMNPCDTTIYSAFVMNRKEHKSPEVPSSKVYIYYTSKMVTNLEERSSYDSSQFVADMGGSLGFLLGLSVIGFIIVLEKVLGYLFLDDIVSRYMQRKEKKRLESKKESEGAKEAKFLDM